MNKSQSAGYIILAIVVVIFTASVFLGGPTTETTELSYSNFLEKLNNNEFSKIEKADDYLIAIPKKEEKALSEEEKSLQGKNLPKAPQSPFLQLEKQIPTKQYKVLTPYDPDIMKKLEASDAEIAVKKPSESSQIMGLIGSLFIPLLFIILLIVTAKSIQAGGSQAMSFGKSKAKLMLDSKVKTTFKDVAGIDEEKKELEEIVDFLKNGDKYIKLGAKIPKGVLLIGAPGTGKTLLARAVAGEAKVPFFSISGSEFIEMFVGMGAARVRDLFKQAQEKAPCIIFIDEIDAIGKKRDSGRFGGNDEREQTLNQLLSEMDGFDGSKGIVILAATNRPDSLDKALLRPGRFDRRIPVELPDLQGREAILRVHAKNIKTEPDIDYKAIARATSGASGAELANIVNEAALRAVRMHRDSVTQSDFEESVEVVIAGYQRKGAVIPKEQKRIVAYHEIGHALVAARQKNSAPVHKITIVPRTSGALGYTMQVSEDDNVLMSKEELFNKITTLTGGRSAEEVIFKSITTGASNDIEQATRIARAMVTRFGMTDEFDMMATETVTNAYLGGDTSLACSETTSGKIDAKVMEIIKDAHAKARAILENDIEKLHELSAYLLEKETITGEEFMYILEHGRPVTKNETSGEVIDTTAAAAEESVEAKEPAAQAEETSTAE